MPGLRLTPAPRIPTEPPHGPLPAEVGLPAPSGQRPGEPERLVNISGVVTMRGGKSTGRGLRKGPGCSAGRVLRSPRSQMRIRWPPRGVWRQPHPAPVQAKFQDSGTSRWKGGQASCMGVRKSLPRWTDKSWQSCWPSQEPGVALFAVYSFLNSGSQGDRRVSALCPSAAGETGQTTIRAAQGLRGH